jgi:hypothetical protein
VSDLLWHYTRQEGLRGILEKKAFWATDVRFQNDGQEYRYALQLLIEEATKKLPDGPYKERLLGTLSFNFLHNDSAYGHPFIVAFSQAADDLSQWRAYAPFGVGFAIGMSSTSLREASESEGANWEDCSYLPGGINSNASLIQDALQEILAGSRAVFESAQDQEDRYDAGSLVTHIVRSNTTVERARIATKHVAFQHERESRIWTRRGQRNVEFRNGRSTILPYISLPLIAKGARVMEIMVGPSSNPELSQRAVEMLCGECAISARVTLSKVPYREL